MARIAKSGLEYFPFDIDFFQDIRIRKLIKRQGGKAVTVYALLLCLIYKNGYYMQWGDELPFIVSETSGFDEAYISEVIKTCLSLGLFDKALLSNEQVLTSKGIQVRYCNIQRLNKRMSRIDKYSLLESPPQKTTENKAKDATKSVKLKTTVSPQVKTHVQSFTNKPVAMVSGNNAEMLAEFFSDNHSENLNMLCKNFGLGPDGIDSLRTLAKAVVAEWELSRTEHKDYSDWSRHLISSMRIKHRDSQGVQNKQKSNSQSESQSQSSDYSFKGGFGGADV